MKKNTLQYAINKIDKFLESTDYESLEDFKKKIDKYKKPEDIEKEIKYLSGQANKPQSTNSSTQKQEDEAKLKYARDKFLDKNKDPIKSAKVDSEVALNESIHDTYFKITYKLDGEEKTEAIECHKFSDKKSRINYLKNEGNKLICKNFEKDCKDPENIEIIKVESLGNIEMKKMRKEVRESREKYSVVVTRGDLVFGFHTKVDADSFVKEAKKVVGMKGGWEVTVLPEGGKLLGNKKMKEMHASEIVAYACDGEVYHEECVDDPSNCDPIFADSEWEYSPICNECGLPIEELGDGLEEDIYDEEYPVEPEPEDITISDSGKLGSNYSVGVVEGKFLGEFSEWDEAVDFIRNYMDKNNFHPNVWYIDDHGGSTIVDMYEQEVFTKDDLNVIIGEKSKSKTARKPRLTEDQIQAQLDDLVKKSFVESESDNTCEVRLFVSGNKNSIRESLNDMAKDLSVNYKIEESKDLLSYFIKDETQALIFENEIKKHFSDEINNNTLKVL